MVRSQHAEFRVTADESGNSFQVFAVGLDRAVLARIIHDAASLAGGAG